MVEMGVPLQEIARRRPVQLLDRSSRSLRQTLQVVVQVVALVGDERVVGVDDHQHQVGPHLGADPLELPRLLEGAVGRDPGVEDGQAARSAGVEPGLEPRAERLVLRDAQTESL